MTNGPTPLVSPCIAVPKTKQPGNLRVGVDMCAPEKESHVVDLNGATLFSKLCMNQGYNHIELAPESRFITTFVTHRGLFRYKRLNSEMNCAAEIFDDVIRNLISGIPGVFNRRSDILVTGKSRKYHDNNLQEVLQRLQDHNLTLNFEKCKFGKRK